MKSFIFLSIVVFLSFNGSEATDLFIGNPTGAQLGYLENVSLTSIPFTVREKNVFYSNDKNQPIKAISALDLGKSRAKVKVTSGGVGFVFANVQIKSERGSGLDYQVQIFV